MLRILFDISIFTQGLIPLIMAHLPANRELGMVVLYVNCHQKYFTLQFRPSPSGIVMMTRRTSPLMIQCIIPICMWNIYNLTNPTLCLLTFLNLG